MKLITRDNVKKLAEHQGNCVSIYCPTHRVASQTQEDRIRLKNQLKDAANQLQDKGLSRPEAHELLAPGMQLLEDDHFWQYQSDSLLLFFAPNLFEKYQLPMSLGECVAVSDHFYLKPLFPVLTNNGSFYLLALDQNHVRVFQGNRFEIHEMKVEDLPTTLAGALRFDDPEAQLHYHAGSTEGKGGSDKEAIYHGHGVGVDDQKDRLLRFFRKIDKGAQSLLKTEKVPLILAGVEYYFPIYQQANNYQHLLDTGITGNPENMSMQELHKKAWAIVEPIAKQSESRHREKYSELAANGQASQNPQQILPAAYEGRVECLFVASDQQVWGKYNEEKRSASIHPEQKKSSEDLLNLAALQVWTKGGTVYTVKEQEMPGEGSTIAALYRY